jgi:hypothetical protein
MRLPKVSISLAIILGLAGGHAFAQQPEHEQSNPAGTPAAGAGVPSGAAVPGLSAVVMMRMMMISMATMARHVEGRIAFLKTELRITDAQQPLWNAVADAMRADAASIGNMSDGMMGIWRPAPLLESLASLEEKMTAQLEAVRRIKAAVDPLYVALSDDQKKTADELILGPMGVF